MIGVDVGEAQRVARASGLVLSSGAQDGPPLSELTWPGVWVVTAQLPPARTAVDRGSVVLVEFERLPGAGGAGDREPRRPLPAPDELRAEREVPQDSP